jgi:hypothetical protein
MLIGNSSGENDNSTGQPGSWTTKDSRTAKRKVGNESVVEVKSIDGGRKQELCRNACMQCGRYDCHGQI